MSFKKTLEKSVKDGLWEQVCPPLIEDECDNCGVRSSTYIDEDDDDDIILTQEELELSRNRQAEWYELFRQEYGLSKDDAVCEQDILDWLGAKFSISRTLFQEI